MGRRRRLPFQVWDISTRSEPDRNLGRLHSFFRMEHEFFGILSGDVSRTRILQSVLKRQKCAACTWQSWTVRTPFLMCARPLWWRWEERGWYVEKVVVYTEYLQSSADYDVNIAKQCGLSNIFKSKLIFKNQPFRNKMSHTFLVCVCVFIVRITDSTSYTTANNFSVACVIANYVTKICRSRRRYNVFPTLISSYVSKLYSLYNWACAQRRHCLRRWPELNVKALN